MQAFSDGVGFFERGRAVEHDARTYPVALDFWPSEHRWRVAQADFRRQPLTRRFEHRDLLGTALRMQFIGAGEVAHQHDFCHFAAGQQTLIGRWIIFRMQADAVHAGIELEPYRDRFAQDCLLDRFELPQRMHHAPEIMLDDQRQLIGFEEAFQQQYRRANPGGTQLQCFFNAGHRKPVSLGFQRLGATHRAMAIGIRLDHRERLGAGDFTGNSVVVTQGLKVDQGTGRTHGGRLLGGHGKKNRR